MKSDVLLVSSREDRTDAVLAQAEKVAAYRDLSHKEMLHLCLLSEEMMSMMNSIAGNMEGKFWIESEGKEFQLHLQVVTKMGPAQREKMLAASTSGQNEAYKGFMGKIRAFFEPVDGLPLFFTVSPDANYSEMSWSMQTYQQELAQYVQQNRQGAAEAWDELEKSVISHVADEVKVRIEGHVVEMTVFKNMP